MDAHKRMLILDVLAKENRQFIVPIYQREYKWRGEECIRLIDDIISCSKTNKEHFIGSIVYQLDKDPNLSDLKLYLVDGQQRITTMLLFTKALSLIAFETDSDDGKYVLSKANKMLFIDSDDVQRGYKIEPSHNDREVFKAIITSKTYLEIEGNPVIKKDSLIYNNFKTAYFGFKEAIEQRHISLKDDIYTNGFLKLSIVEITLNYEENAQEIFESINSLGVDLTNADLIRNFLLMSNKNQRSLFEDKWKPMQDTLIGENNMEDFVKNYLLMKRSYNIENKNVYKEYVQYANEFVCEDEIDREALVTDLYNCAQIFEPFLKISDSYNDDTNHLMQELRDMEQTTAYPFLMKVFLDHKSKIIDSDVLNKVINLIVVYLTRRTICGIPTNSLRGFMLNLYNRIFEKVPQNKEKYYESIYAFLTTLSSRDKMPSTTDLQKKLPEYSLYKNLKFATYVLYKIENGRFPNRYSEYTLANSPTVEHIMPQNLTEEWEKAIGSDALEFHEKYINTLGNLSLSSRKKNSVMSDESFSLKKNVLLTDGSKFEVLNGMLKTLNSFTKKDLIDREKKLADILLDKYKLDPVDTTGVRFDDIVEVICDEEVNPIFTGSSPISFSLFGNEVRVDNFASIVSKVCKILLKKTPEKIRQLAESGYTPWDGDNVYLAYSNPDKQWDYVDEGIVVNTRVSAVYAIDFCVKLIKECGFDSSELVVFLKKDSINKQNMLKKSQRVSLIRSSLEQLATEDVILYDYSKMPKSDSYIKFQTKELNLIFNNIDYLTSWDSERFLSIQFAEIAVSSGEVWLTLKSVKNSLDIVNKLEVRSNELALESHESGSNYWHFKKYQIDFEKIINCDDSKNEMINQLRAIADDIKQLALKISS